MNLKELINLYSDKDIKIGFKSELPSVNAKYPRYYFYHIKSHFTVDAINVNINNLTVSLRSFPYVIVEHNNLMFDPIVTKKFHNHVIFNGFLENKINHPYTVIYKGAIASKLPSKLVFEETYTAGFMDAYLYEVKLIQRKFLNFLFSDLEYQYPPVHDFKNMNNKKIQLFKEIGISELGYKSKSEKKPKHSLTFKFDISANRIVSENIIISLRDKDIKLNKSELEILDFARFCYNAYLDRNFCLLARLKQELKQDILDLSIKIFTDKMFLLNFHRKRFVDNFKEKSEMVYRGKTYKVTTIYKTK